MPEAPAGLRLVSIQVGTPQSYLAPDDGGTYRSAIDKRPVAGRVQLTTTGLAGDAVADRRAHGGPDQAMLAYAEEHFARWAGEGLEGLGPGAFGENLTVRGTDEDEVAIGDRWSIGEVIVEVSKPRTPCNRLAWRHGRSDLIHRVRETGRSGWYLRVLQEGWLEAGTPIELQARPHPTWTVRRTAQVMANHQSL
ncbi:MAG TPA: MOSC domain-containing protein, partial [Gemmatimonadales bacterium]|nr:MOSC domain-containing protein [Gemmatimonadales bacterium]